MSAALAKLVAMILKLLVASMLVLLVIVALYASLGRYYVPMLGEYKTRIFESLSAVSGLSMDAESLRGSWQHYYPVLYVENLRVAPAGTDLGKTSLSSNGSAALQSNKETAPSASIVITELKLALDPLASLRDRSLRLKALGLFGLELNLDQDSEGKWGLQGFSRGKGAGLEPLKEFLTTIEKIDLSHTAIRMKNQGGSVASIEALSLLLKREANFRRLVVHLERDADEAHGTGAQIYAVVEGEGSPFDPSAFAGAAYLRTLGADFSPYLDVLLPDFIVSQLRADAQLWARWQPGTGVEIQGQVLNGDVTIESREHAIDLNDVKSDFRVEYAGQNWEGWLSYLHAQHQEQSIRLEKIQLRAKRLKAERLQLMLGTLRLNELEHVLTRSTLLPDKVRDVIAGIRPEGMLDNILIELPLRKAQLAALKVEGDLKEVKTQAWKGIPGGEGIWGHLTAGLLSGQVLLNQDRPVALSFPTLYDEALQLNRLNGAVDWHFLSDRVQLGAKNLQLAGSFGTGHAAFHLELPRKPGLFDPDLVLAIGLDEGDLRHRSQLIPNVLSADLRQWLADSELVGDVELGRLLFRGKLERDSDETPTIQLYVNAHNVAIDYQPPWPKVSDADVALAIVDQEVNLTASSAVLLETALSDVEIKLVHDAENKPEHLNINGRFAGEARHALRFLQQTPVREVLGDFIDQWQLAGEVQGGLKLKVPLVKQAQLNVETSIDFDKVKLTVPDLRLSVDHIYGRLDYSTDEGLASEQLRGRLWGEPLRAELRSDLSLSPPLMMFEADTQVSADALLSWTELPFLALSEGKTAAHAQFRLQGDDAQFKVSSSLLGLRVNVPAPLGKSVLDTREFNLSLFVSDEQQPWLMQYGPSLKGRFKMISGVMRQGQLVFGEGDFISESDPVLLISGQMDQFNLEQWLDTQSRLSAAEQAMQARLLKSASITEETMAQREQQTLPIQINRFKLSEVTAFDQTLYDLTTSVFQFDDFWRVQLSNEVLEGAIEVYRDERPMAIALDRLQIAPLLAAQAPKEQTLKDPSSIEPSLKEADQQQTSELALLSEADDAPILLQDEGIVDADADAARLVANNSGRTSDETARESSGPSPLGMSPFNLSIRELLNGEDDLGSWRFELTPVEHGVKLAALQAQIKGITVGGFNDSGEQTGATVFWLEKEGVQRTSFDGELSCTDMAKVMKQWGYEAFLTSRSCHFNAKVDWPGNPTEFDMAKVSGRSGFKLRDGTFVNAPDGASSALKVVGILNLTQILRRLKLDFSDLSGQGLAYDQVSGVVDAKDGVMAFNKPLVVDGVSSEMRLSGTIDVGKKWLDTEMVVTLPIGSNLPWIAAMAVNLPAAAGVYVISKILKRQVNKLSSAVYSLKGDWDNPAVKFERLFDDQGKKPQADQGARARSDGSEQEAIKPEDKSAEPDTVAPKPQAFEDMAEEYYD
jgi:uncharacterized protein (TIGR02099 family)